MVIDGNSIINRAYYGIRPLTTREGLYTHAIYGFLSTMSRLKDEEKPDALCVTFDRREPTFRHLEYDGYKAQRKGMPEELAMQMPLLKEVLDAMNIPRYELAGYEADDLIGTISRKCEAAGWDCVVVTGDKDSLQLITDHTKVKLVSTRMGQTTTRDMTPQSFREEYGFAPVHIIDLKALMGDSSDNIPGVPGVGEKTAMALIQRYETVEAIYAALPEIEAKPNVIKKLTEGADSARMSYHLATIVTDAPLAFAPEEARVREDYKPELYGLFVKLEFTKFIDKWKIQRPAEAAAAPKTFEGRCTMTELLTDADVTAAAQEIIAAGGTLYIRSTPDYGCFAFQIDLIESEAKAYLLDEMRFAGDWDAALRALFAPSIPKAGHEIKDLQRYLLDHDLPVDKHWVFDTALAGYLINATASSYDLRLLCQQYGGFEPYDGSAGENGDGQISLLDEDGRDEEKRRAERYAVLASEAAAIAALRSPMQEKLAALGMEELYFSVELPLCRVLAEMEHAGCLVDRNALSDFGALMETRVRELEGRIYDAAGGPFNINSPKQLGTVLFEQLKLPHGKKTKTGWSTNADVLEKLRWEHPIVSDVLEYRQYAKFKSTYCDGLLKVIAPDGRIHTSFMMTVTDTGRLSSREPNLQNIPTRTELGSEFRRMFVPAEGCVLVDADYSQIELRLLAHIAGDETMRNAFRDGEDIHTVTASQVFGVPVELVSKQMRSHAKAVNFGIVYGISAFSLAQDIGVPMSEAKAYIESYLSRFSGIHRYMTEVVEQAKERGYVETLMHRRRALPELTASNFATRSFGERVALNMPIQGTAADIIKLAMVRVDERLRREGLQGRLILQVHDELIVECPECEAEQVSSLLTEEMERVMTLSVPLTAEAHWGKNWLEAKG